MTWLDFSGHSLHKGSICPPVESTADPRLILNRNIARNKRHECESLNQLTIRLKKTIQISSETQHTVPATLN